ncbi:MAG: hypothetical protein K2L78_02310, partial [Muribaculaceae bacterium]|nr:hypothetical protein [Muribaculaceae bacterium]
VRECLGGIYEFLEKKKIASLQELELSKSPGTGTVKPSAEKTDKAVAAPHTSSQQPRLTYAEQREREKMLRRATKKVEEAEAKVGQAEQEIARIEARISAGETEGDIFEQHQTKTREMETAMSLWELASQELDELKARFESSRK